MTMKYKALCYVKHRWVQHPEKTNVKTCKRCGWRKVVGWGAETKGKVKTKILTPE